MASSLASSPCPETEEGPKAPESVEADEEEPAERTFQADDIVSGVRDRPEPTDPDALPDATVEIHGLAEASIQATSGGEEGFVYGAAIQLARLQARFEDPGHFGAVIQLEAASGTVQLLDAAARIGDRGGHNLLIGRFKTFLSDDYLVPAGQMIFPTRGLLTGIATKRMVGIQGTGRFGSVRVKGGLFNPTGMVPKANVGAIAMEGVDFELGHGLHLHAAVSHWLRPQGALEELEPDDRVWQNQGDLALVYHEHGWTIATEALVAEHRDSHVLHGLHEAWDAGVLGVVARRFPVGKMVEIEPAVAWDSLWEEESLVHRGSAAVNLHKEDWRMVETVAVEVEHGAEETPKSSGLTSRVLLQVQVAL
jgi:hypothetical protein